MLDEAEAFDDVRPGRSRGCATGRALHSHHQQSDDYGDVAHAIGEETPAFSDLRDQNSSNGRTDDAGAVEHGRVQGDGVHQIFFTYHVDEEGLAAGNVEGI